MGKNLGNVFSDDIYVAKIDIIKSACMNARGVY